MTKAKQKTSEQGINVTVNYDPSVNKLFMELEAHLASLRNILNSINKNTYAKTGSQSVNGGFLGLTIGEREVDQTKLIQSEIQKTFVDFMRSFIDFLDAVIGINNFIKTPSKIPKTIKTMEDLQKYIDETIKNKIRKVAKTQTSNAKKLKMLPTLSPRYNSAIEGWFAIRRSIEHHKSMAEKDIDLSLQKQALFTDDGKEIKNVPLVLEKASTISLKVEWSTRKYKKGEEVTLAEIDLEHLLMTIHTCIVPELITKLVQLNSGAAKK